MRHVYECPMRWADLDLLGHVNNVVYLDYLQEARVDMLRVHARSPRTDGLAEGVVVVDHQATYLTPLLFDFSAVRIECWVTEIRAASFTMAYEVFREYDGVRTVYLRATTMLSPYVFATESPRRLTAEEKADLEPYLEPSTSQRPRFTEPKHTDIGRFPLKVRFSDVDAYGHANNVQYFEFFQEARLAMMRGLVDRMPEGTPWPAVVVASSDVAYRRPVLCRPETYEVWSWVSSLGNKSMTIEAEILDPTHASTSPGTAMAHGRTTVVFYDNEAGRSRPAPAELRKVVDELF